MKTLENRPDINSYFMRLAIMASERGTCLRRRTGAVFVIDRHPVAMGYNGTAKGQPHCITYGKEGCYTGKQNNPSGHPSGQLVCRAAHAEENAILQAARLGLSLKGSTLYSTNEPCGRCSRQLINLGIEEVYWIDEYNDPESRQILMDAFIVSKQLQWKNVIPIGYHEHWLGIQNEYTQAAYLNRIQK